MKRKQSRKQSRRQSRRQSRIQRIKKSKQKRSKRNFTIAKKSHKMGGGARCCRRRCPLLTHEEDEEDAERRKIDPRLSSSLETIQRASMTIADDSARENFEDKWIDIAERERQIAVAERIPAAIPPPPPFPPPPAAAEREAESHENHEIPPPVILASQSGDTSEDSWEFSDEEDDGEDDEEVRARRSALVDTLLQAEDPQREAERAELRAQLAELPRVARRASQQLQAQLAALQRAEREALQAEREAAARELEEIWSGMSLSDLQEQLREAQATIAALQQAQQRAALQQAQQARRISMQIAPEVQNQLRMGQPLNSPTQWTSRCRGGPRGRN